MIKTLLIVSLFAFIQIGSCNKTDTPSNTNAKTPNVNKTKNTAKNSKAKEDSKNNLAEKFLTIRELNEQKPSKGIFETKGYVVKKTNCKACPPNAQCKPCMAENILISEENKSLDKYDLTEKELIIFTKDSENFSKGEQYKFTIKITDKKTTSAKLNDIELISSEPIND